MPRKIPSELLVVSLDKVNILFFWRSRKATLPFWVFTTAQNLSFATMMPRRPSFLSRMASKLFVLDVTQDAAKIVTSPENTGLESPDVKGVLSPRNKEDEPLLFVPRLMRRTYNYSGRQESELESQQLIETLLWISSYSFYFFIFSRIFKIPINLHQARHSNFHTKTHITQLYHCKQNRQCTISPLVSLNLYQINLTLAPLFFEHWRPFRRGIVSPLLKRWASDWLLNLPTSWWCWCCNGPV